MLISEYEIMLDTVAITEGYSLLIKHTKLPFILI